MICVELNIISRHYQKRIDFDLVNNLWKILCQIRQLITSRKGSKVMNVWMFTKVRLKRMYSKNLNYTGSVNVVLDRYTAIIVHRLIDLWEIGLLILILKN